MPSTPLSASNCNSANVTPVRSTPVKQTAAAAAPAAASEAAPGTPTTAEEWSDRVEVLTKADHVLYEETARELIESAIETHCETKEEEQKKEEAVAAAPPAAVEETAADAAPATPDVEEWHTILNDGNVNWSRRLDAFKGLQKTLNGAEAACRANGEWLAATWRRFEPCLLSQMKAMRSSLVKEAISTVKVFALFLDVAFAPMSSGVFDEALALSANPIESISAAGADCIRALLAAIGPVNVSSIMVQKLKRAVAGKDRKLSEMALSFLTIIFTAAANDKDATTHLAKFADVFFATLTDVKSTQAPKDVTDAAWDAFYTVFPERKASQAAKPIENVSTPVKQQGKIDKPATPKQSTPLSQRQPSSGTITTPNKAATPTRTVKMQPGVPEEAPKAAIKVAIKPKAEDNKVEEEKVEEKKVVEEAKVEVQAAPAAAPAAPAVDVQAAVDAAVKEAKAEFEAKLVEEQERSKAAISQANQENMILMMDFEETQAKFEAERAAKGEMEKLVREFEATVTTLVEQLEQSKDGSKKEIASLTKQRDELASRVDKAEHDAKVLHAKYTEMKEIDLRQKQTEVTLSMELKDVSKKLNASEEKYRTMKEAADKKLSSVAVTISDLRQSEEAKSEELDKLLAKYAKVSEQLATKEAAVKELSTATSAMEKETATMTKELNQLRSSSTESSGRLKVLEAENSFYTTKNEELSRLLTETQEKEQHFVEENARLQRKLQDKDTIQSANEGLSTENKRLEEENKQLKVQVYDFTVNAKSSAGDDAKVKELTAQLAAKTKETAELQALCEQMIAQLEDK